MIGEYINKIKNNLGQLTNLKKAVGRYKLLISQFGEKFVNEAITEIKKEKGKDTLTDIEVFIAYEEEIKNRVWKKHGQYISTPIDEIEKNNLEEIAKKYNTTLEKAKIIVDLNIVDPYIAASLANIILKFNIKDNPNAIEIAHVIYDNNLSSNKDAVTIAEIIIKNNLKDNPESITIANYIMNNNLIGETDAVGMYNFITNNNLKDNFDAVSIANMSYKYGVPLDLAMEISQFNNGVYGFRQTNEKYIFHKLRQFYQIKNRVEKNLNIQEETSRIMKYINCDDVKARYLLISCLGNNWGRNSSIYWNYEQFKTDFSSEETNYTPQELAAIKGYVNQSSINQFARGFTIENGQTIYSDGVKALELTQDQIKMTREGYYKNLYDALNKRSLSKDVVVFRGASMSSLKKYNIDQNDSEEEILKKLGGSYYDGGFVSTSTTPVKGGSGDFLENNDVNFIIDLKAGTPCGELSQYTFYDTECEILIPPNVTFNVSDVKKIDGKIFVYLTSIPTKSLSYKSSVNEEEISEGRSL